MFIGVIKSYCQDKNLFDVYYDVDGATESYSFKEVMSCLKLFERLYGEVSINGHQKTDMPYYFEIVQVSTIS